MPQPRLTAGELDRRIRIVPLTETQNATGEPIASDQPGTPLWAKKLQETVSQRFSGASDQAAADLIFRVRWRDDVARPSVVVFPASSTDPKDRYELVAIAEYGRRVGLDLTCRRLGSNV